MSVSEDFYKQVGVFSNLSIQDRSLLIGDITSLLLCSKLHRQYLINDIGSVFFPAIHLNQFRIYRSKQGNVVGLVTWAFLSDEIQKKYEKEKYYLKPEDFNSGKNGWIIDFVAPFGQAKMMIKDLRNIFPGQRGKALRLGKNGEVKRVWNVR